MSLETTTAENFLQVPHCNFFRFVAGYLYQLKGDNMQEEKWRRESVKEASEKTLETLQDLLFNLYAAGFTNVKAEIYVLEND